MCARKKSTLKKLLTVAECPSHPSESFASDTREANPALSPFHRPALTPPLTHVIPWSPGRTEPERTQRNMVWMIN